MSDIYLELRSRIPVVAQTTHIGTARLQEAQDAVGLSNERIAHAIPVSEKTWRRWKAAGAVPTSALPKLALVLRLELVEPPQSPLRLVDPAESAAPRGLLQELGETVDQVVELLEELARNQAEILGQLAELRTQLVPERARPRSGSKARR